jgi:UDP-N-acetylglucosamine 4,6-dehydratase/5-epimerase
MKKLDFGTLLITGGTGSFGESFLNMAIEEFKFDEIRVYSRDEKKQDDLRNKLKNSNISFYIGDVRDKNSVKYASRGVDYIFHAAALKQVPSCEFFPIQAVKTNILGTENVLDLAAEEKVKKVVVLSTDKAAYPVNVMGMTKALMEKVMIAKSRNSKKSTIFCGTRYGNVMGSRGSVIPLFINQIKQKKDITITNPEMTRFIMTLTDAVDLVKYAFINANQGEIFVQKSPAVSLDTLANALLKLYDSNSKIKTIGVRHGEKMYETLITNEEMVFTEDKGDYYKLSPDSRDLNYSKYFSEGNDLYDHKSEINSKNSGLLSLDQTVEILRKLPLIQDDFNL